MKQVRIERAGQYVDVIVSPVSKGRPDRHERVAARNCSSELRQKLNDKTAAEKFKRVLASNFKPGDMVVTLTYSDDRLPTTPEQAVKQRLKPFISKLRKEYQDLGDPFKYVYVTECRHGEARLHHHIVVPDIPELREIIRKHWAKNGTVTGFNRINSKGYRDWAYYLSKEPRKTGRRYVGLRMWTPSLGLNKPEVTTYEISDKDTYEPPAGVVILENRVTQWEWFSGQYVSYYAPEYSTK